MDYTNYIITGTNRKLSVTYCGNINYILYMEFENMRFIELAQIFSDENETSRIEYYYDEGQPAGTYTGFTMLTDIMYSGENKVRVTLNKQE